ncbi:MAG TPA: succinylglutamate-semialdehyde dehydrogenase [Tepidisphaeraceae bacterium]|jgi:succinylglutamic semialdehyde dehydrogenase|nr:succinylglutamate-semialdehyde dehydrogenase [Tepidisphaeraceae bacterium]
MTPTNSPEISRVVSAARAAFATWSGAAVEDRIRLLLSLEQRYRAEKEKIAQVISSETAKPLWESRLEVDSMSGKIPISIDAYRNRCREQSRPLGEAVGFTRFRPHGVLAVLGPFNMPGHLPNGHIVPALLAGNTIVFKPSEQTPRVGELLAEAFRAAKFPPGVFNIIQGGKEVGAVLAQHPDVNGILFTGSTAGGIALRRAAADDPGKILALEMGGNNPLIVHQAQDLTAAACIIIQSAYITAGQRCTCARRLIVVRGSESDALIQGLLTMIRNIRIGFPNDDPPPFMGPVISPQAAANLLRAQANLLSGGGVALIEMKPSPRSPALLTPGLIDVTNIANRPDAEFFGPMLQLIRVDDFDAAVREANHTAYGLSAGLISDNADLYQKFLHEIRAGVVAWNRPLTGASSHLPFGGVGQSGNHRPGGYFAADYAAYPVAALESPRAQLPSQLPPGIVA